MDPLLFVFILCCFPWLSMTLGSLLVRCWVPGARFTSSVQHFAAGIVIAAVGLELLPPITSKDATSVWDYVAIATGFSIAVAILLIFDHFTKVAEKEKEDCTSANVNNETTTLVGQDSVARGRLPWGMILPVAIDACIDGLLIGISYVAGTSAGVVMTFAVSMEMCFLGITASIALQKREISRRKSILFCVSIPCFIPIFGIIGVEVLSRLSGAPFLGVIAFGMAALLYLVADELLVEAHESMESHSWFVTVQFFVGFLLAVMLQKATG